MIVVFALAIWLPFPARTEEAVSVARRDPDLDRACARGRRRGAPARASSFPTRSRSTSPRGSTSSASSRSPRSSVVLASGAVIALAGPGVVAHLVARPLRQQHAPLEHRAVLLLHGRPPLGQVLHGRLARPPRADLDHRRDRVPRLDRDRVHRLPDPAELRLAVDRRPGEGRAERRRASAPSSTSSTTARCCSGTSCCCRSSSALLIAGHVLLVRRRGVVPPLPIDGKSE